jgi:hypothetical protein
MTGLTLGLPGKRLDKRSAVRDFIRIPKLKADLPPA